MTQTLPSPAIGDNFGSGAEAFKNEIAQFVEDCKRLAETPIDEKTERLLADLVIRERKLRQTATMMKDGEKRPFLDACSEIDARFNMTVDALFDALAAPKAKLREHLLAEDKRREDDARRAREDAERKAAEAASLRAAAADADPFERYDARERIEDADEQAASAARAAETASASKVKIASAAGLGRSVGLKIVRGVKIADYDTALLHFAQNAGVKDAVYKAALAIAKATKFKEPIPGVVFTETKEIA